ncbi:GFA family protein [Marinomonas sp. M1K-6]|uniref:GFA family protein n=1 Tax=Marinomonas profundi TaxID=2726122 RepID=A0A847R993_9GAMM|nr:GFA family protein [Marinomonas profundi]NLQ18626.1 GFA family protein [Marinomonas profundi]UDV02880.1 GFA family protein [Marinomonas profundi]
MLSGSCLCNGIQYEIRSELGDIMQCHCQNCRKANGSAFAANAAIPSTAFALLKGEELLAEYESSPGVFRVFCKRCASPLYSRRPHMPELLRLRIGTLDAKIEGKPSSHIFVGSKAEWHEICDDIPQYEERPVT